MLNVLIVDDEVHFVEAVKKMADWPQLGISTVHVAYSALAAEQIFQAHDIHVLLCDIEMPQRSGLDLLESLRRRQLQTVPILMTCHADFHFAREAVRLGCSHYLLKPLSKEELEAAIGKAADTANREQELAEAQRNKMWWSTHQKVYRARFWMDLLNETIPANSEAVRREAAARQIPLLSDAGVLPVLVVVRNWQLELPQRDRKLLEYALQNAGEEQIGRLVPGSDLVQLQNEAWLLIIPAASTHEVVKRELAIACGSFAMFCKQHLYCEVSCYFGSPIAAHDISSTLSRLLSLDRNNVNGEPYVCLDQAERPTAVSPALPVVPDMSGWATLLQQGVKERLLKETRSFVRGLRLQSGINSRYLHAFKEDFLQMVHVVLQRQGVQAHLMFCDEGSLRLAEASSRSLADLERWLTHVIIQAAHYTHIPSSLPDVIGRATRYILSNLDQNLSREAAANHVYLHPDYLTRLFKKELGCTIPEFILQERLKLAKQLLAHSELSVSAVAMAVGYSNFSHFAKLFKQHSGLTPVDFRHSGGEGASDKVEIAAFKSRS
ncbi:response regulator [Paenibacillus guangzhouensis]|uniref:response regulator n=1 Tax=Paenibacillus guangzhouensis TaxID=1473112 RepID=UPI001266BAEB|nr:response regulator [Paenibacillus guangzhouensis]